MDAIGLVLLCRNISITLKYPDPALIFASDRLAPLLDNGASLNVSTGISLSQPDYT